MRTVENLSIMPLDSVLFPGTPVTLYIHEKRYDKMLEEAIASEGFFGVALRREEEGNGPSAVPHDVGTIARIREVTDLPDGTKMVLAEGGARFQIRSVVSSLPVLRADVELIDEPAGICDDDAGAVETARRSFAELMSLVMRTMGAELVDPEPPGNPVQLSYSIAANLQIALPELQELLELETAAERLRTTLPLLEREIRHYRVLALSREKLESLGITGNDELPFSRS